MRNIIHVRGAEPIADQIAVPAKIIIDGHYPSTTKNDLDQLREAFLADAERLFIALRSLPGGTFDQLLILMLQKTATSFVVPHRFHDESKAHSMLALLEKALPIIEREAAMREEADCRTGEGMMGRYFVEMRDLANEISAEIDRAKGKGVSDGA